MDVNIEIKKQFPKTGSYSFPTDAERVKISVLSSSILYFLDFVFIVAHMDSFRLVVIHDGELLTDKHYESVRGAKIAFNRLYSYRAWSKGLESDWSCFYHPTPQWLNERKREINTSYT